MSRRCSGLSRAGRRARPLELVYRTARPPVQALRPPAPQIIRNTVHQTVVHLHQTTHRHIRITAGAGGQNHTTVLVRQSAAAPAEERAMDPSRPGWTARRLLRILSTESARRITRPFYREMFRSFWEREREEHRGRPARSLLLVERLLGRRQALVTLRRFYRRTAERPDGAVLHSLICRRYVRYTRRDEEGGFIYRHVLREPPGQPRPLPAAQRSPPPPQPPPEREPGRELRAEPQRAQPPAAGVLRLSGSDFQFLVRGVADALSRQSRLTALRQGEYNR